MTRSCFLLGEMHLLRERAESGNSTDALLMPWVLKYLRKAWAGNTRPHHRLLVQFFVPEDAPIVVGIDETSERRRGAKLTAKRITVAWYGETTRPVALASETAIWYHNGLPPVQALRWVLIRDPLGQMDKV